MDLSYHEALLLNMQRRTAAMNASFEAYYQSAARLNAAIDRSIEAHDRLLIAYQNCVQFTSASHPFDASLPRILIVPQPRRLASQSE